MMPRRREYLNLSYYCNMIIPLLHNTSAATNIKPYYTYFRLALDTIALIDELKNEGNHHSDIFSRSYANISI